MTSTAVATGAFADPNFNPFSSTAQEMGGSQTAFVKFDGNRGAYLVGQDEVEIPEGSRLAIQLMLAQKGWICWKDGEVVDERIVMIASGTAMEREEDLPDHGPYTEYDDGTKDGWSKVYILPMFSLADGEAYEFKTSSASGIRSVNGLLNDFGRLFRQNPGKTPVVELGSTSFKAKVKGKEIKKFAPTFKIAAWTDDSAPAAQIANGAEDESNYEQNEEAAPETPPAPPPAAEKPAAPATTRRPRAAAPAPAPQAPAPEPEAPAPQASAPAASGAAPTMGRRARAF